MPRTYARILTGAVIASTAVCSGAVASNAALLASPASPNKLPAVSAVPRFAPVYMSYVTHTKPTASQALAVARSYDVIAANGLLAPYVKVMHQANPKLVLVAYVNGMYTPKSEHHPENWYAHDKNKRRITTHMFGNYLMDPSSPSWRAAVAASCASAVARTHYDGCFLDNLGQAMFHPGYVTGTPVNGGKPWTTAAWMQADVGLAGQVQAKSPSAVLVANGLGNGRGYFGAGGTAPLLTPVAGAMSETWLRLAGDSVSHFRSESDWKSDVDMLAAGKSVLVTCKLWVKNTPAQADAWHQYALASFLLGASGKAFFNFSNAQSWTGITAGSTMDSVNIGTPVGGYHVVGGAYLRSYSQGFVAAHPNTGSVRVTLPAGTFRDVHGKTVNGSITLGAHQGSVLTRS